MKTWNKILLFILIAKAFGFIKELLLLSKFGLTSDLDDYNLVTITSMATSGFLVSIINNYFVDYFKSSSTDSLFVLLKKTLFIIPIIPVLYFLIMAYYTDLELILMILGSAIVMVYFVSGLLSAFIMAKGAILNSYVEFIPAFLLCLVLLCDFGIGTLHLVWSLLLGLVMQCIIFLSFILGNKFHGSSYVSVSLTSIRTIIIAQFLALAVPFIDSFAVLSFGDGELAGFSFAQRIIGVGMALITIIANRLILPTLSRTSTIEERKGLLLISDRIFLSLFFLVAVCELVLLTLSVPLLIGKYLGILLLFVPFYTYNVILLNAHAAFGNYRVLLISSLIGLVIKLLSYCLSLKFDFLWVPWSLVIMSIFTSLYIKYTLFKEDVTT